MLPVRYPSIMQSAIRGRCPRCRRGSMFEGPILSFGSRKMRSVCPHCGLKFEKEPGYFYVAMYISYVFVVAELIVASLTTYLFTKDLENPWTYVIVLAVVILALAPINYRYSRIVLMYWLTPQFKFQSRFYERKASLRVVARDGKDIENTSCS